MSQRSAETYPASHPVSHPAQHTRRQVLISAAAGGALLATPRWLPAVESKDVLNLAFIGVGGRGGGNLNTLAMQGKEPRAG